MAAPRSWDVFCRVVDNFGDAAVCWRLARALARLPGAPDVRLWIDEPEVLHVLMPAVEPHLAEQACDGVQICRLVEGPWSGTPADVAVDGFGAGLPEAYAEAMAVRVPRPLWIVLEYLSAEPWVATRHGLPSPHPRLPVERYFFFPGFDRDTGGLLREADLAERRSTFLSGSGREALWRDAGFPLPARDALSVSLFGYENDAAAALLAAWCASSRPIVAAVPASRLTAQVAAFMRVAHPAPGTTARSGNLEVRFLPFLPQDRYDELLWACDWNFVRGEDSFVRAQWAERPMVWQPYPQADDAHLVKLQAFLDRYCEGLDVPLAEALRALFLGWNSAPGTRSALAPAWETAAAAGATLERHAAAWAARAAAAGDLAINLARFCSDRLK